MIAKVIRIDLDLYYLSLESGEVVTAKVRGNQKKRGNVLVGDVVEVEKANDDYMIKTVRNRVNSLIRPPVANIDQMIIVVSVGEPQADFILLDKQIVLCMSKSIRPIICVNKVDLADNNEQAKADVEYIEKVYKDMLGFKVLFVSAEKEEGIEELKEILRGKTSAFSGNSGVGKSTITRLIADIEDEEEIEVGEIGRKSKRGKHTTKSVRIYRIENDTYILDTPGFSSYELYDIEYRELMHYYPDFEHCVCDYDDCAHVIEDIKVCDVKRKLEEGSIDQGRYERYVYIYERLKEQYDRRYK